MKKYFIFAILAGVAALILASILSALIKKESEGSGDMKEIASYIEEGANAFLKREYKYLTWFIVIVTIIILIFLQWQTAVCFICGAVLSMLAGHFGMSVATKANVRTAEAAKNSSNDALSIAFSGGSVMGMSVVGLGIMGLSILVLAFGSSSNFSNMADIIQYISGFGLGASSIALFARVGGGIYTKAADVGADLVGKVEAGIPEDDPRNPAVIADNVGDNVGDVAGMGADLFESYVGSIISALTLGILVFEDGSGIIYPFALCLSGIIASIIGVLCGRNSKSGDAQKTLNNALYIASTICVIASAIFSNVIFGGYKPFAAVAAGLVVGILIGKVTEIYTSADYRHVKKIASQSETGSATTIITGLSVGMCSTFWLVIFVALGILVSFYSMDGATNVIKGLYGISLSAVGMLTVTGLTVAVDAYGPIADNAGGIAEMSDLPSEVREITDKLDSVGNTTAAVGKGFAIGSAALTALALFASYANAVELEVIDILNSVTLVGLLIGAMLPFLFAALTMESVGKAANQMIAEVRRQFKEIPGIMEGKAKPDYKKCVDISTDAALKEMILPGVLALAFPIVIGLLLGPSALAGLLAGAVVTGFLMAVFMSNSGGAWDNAKKYIEEGNHGGKGSVAHKAAVVGDTVGDPFKDTSGPSMNILIKLMSIVSLVFAPLIFKYGGIFFK